MPFRDMYIRLKPRPTSPDPSARWLHHDLAVTTSRLPSTHDKRIYEDVGASKATNRRLSTPSTPVALPSSLSYSITFHHFAPHSRNKIHHCPQWSSLWHSEMGAFARYLQQSQSRSLTSHQSVNRQDSESKCLYYYALLEKPADPSRATISVFDLFQIQDSGAPQRYTGHPPLSLHYDDTWPIGGKGDPKTPRLDCANVSPVWTSHRYDGGQVKISLRTTDEHLRP
jgi:hypothetical protein